MVAFPGCDVPQRARRDACRGRKIGEARWQRRQRLLGGQADGPHVRSSTGAGGTHHDLTVPNRLSVEIARGSRHTIEMNAKPATALEPDHEEILEWIEAFDEVIDQEGPGQSTRLLDALTRRARESNVDVPVQLNTPYVNTIPIQEELPYPGDRQIERRIKSLIR